MGKAASKLSSEQISELTKSTQFDRKELSQWYQGFLRDAPNGFLTKTDLFSLYQQFFPFGDPLPFADHMFRLMDTNRNGMIEFSEFIKALSIAAKGTLDERIAWAFRLYDVDGDGCVSKDDMRQLIGAMYQMVGRMVSLTEDEDTPEKRVNKIFSRVEKVQEDRLSLEEFKSCARQDPTILQAMSLYEGLV